MIGEFVLLALVLEVTLGGNVPILNVKPGSGRAQPITPEQFQDMCLVPAKTADPLVFQMTSHICQPGKPLVF